MFRDDAQAARAIRALLGTLGLEDLWHQRGPSQSAVALRRDAGRSLSPAQGVLLDAAWALWDRSTPPPVHLDQVIRVLDRRTCEALFSLLIAYLDGPDAVETWVSGAALRRAPEGPLAIAGDVSAARTSSCGTAWVEDLGQDWPTLDVLSMRYIRAVIERQQGNQARAADVLGVDRRTLSRVLAKVRSGRVPAMQTRR